MPYVCKVEGPVGVAEALLLEESVADTIVGLEPEDKDATVELEMEDETGASVPLLDSTVTSELDKVTLEVDEPEEPEPTSPY